MLRKLLNLKFISATISVIFLFTGILYSAPFSNNALRLEIGSKHLTFPRVLKAEQIVELRKTCTSMFNDLLEIAGELQDMPVKDVEKKIEAVIFDRFVKLYNLTGELEGVEIDDILQKQIKEQWIKHSIAVLATLFQLENAKYTPDPDEQIRLQRLSVNDNNGERTEKNLERMREVYAGKLKKWIAITLLHDIGRITETPEIPHESEGSRLIKKYSLLDDLDLPEEDCRAIPLIVKYHVYTSLTLNGEYSLIKLGDILQEDEVESANCKDILQDIALVWLFDVTGVTSKGLVTNVRVEYAFGLNEIILRNLDFSSLGQKLEKESIVFLPIRIAGMISFNDSKQSAHVKDGKLNNDNYEFYWEKFLRAEEKLEIKSEQWQYFLNNFHRVFMRYINYNFSKLAWVDDNIHALSEVNQKEQFKRENEIKQSYLTNPNVAKLLVLLTQLLHHYDAQNIEIMVGDAKGKRVDDAGRKVDQAKEHDYALELNRVLFTARDMQLDGEECYFIDKDGAKIEGVNIVSLGESEGRLILSFRISLIDKMDAIHSREAGFSL